MNKLKQYLRQRSTYVGLVAILGVAGISVPVEALNSVGTGVLALLGLIETFRDEDK